MLSISLFQRDTKPTVQDTVRESWREFVARLRKAEPSATPKRDLGLWSPASFREGYRNKDNVESVCLLTLDVDEDPVPSSAQLRDVLDGLQAVAHSSSSATRLFPRWRVGIALSRPVTGEEYKKIWSTFTSALPFKVGQQAKDPARAWYLPRQGPDDYYELFETSGTAIDVDYLLDQAPAPPPLPDRAPAQGSPAPEIDRHSTAARLLGEHWPPKGQRLQARLSLSGSLCHSGLSQEEAHAFMCEVHKHVPDRGDVDDRKLAGIVSETYSKAETGSPIAKWGTLAQCVNPSITQVVQGLLKPPGVAAAELEMKGLLEGDGGLVFERAERSEKREKKEGLAFEYGAWESEPPPVEFLVDGLIPRGCVAMWYGRADSLKTWLLYSLAISMARGEPWLGKVCKQLKVGIVDYETGKGNVKRRLYMLRAGSTQNLGTVAFASLKPNQPEFWKELAKEGFDIVFIDSLRRSNPGGDENDSGEAIVPLELAAEFSEATGCAVVYIHHAKKATADGWPEFRGSAAIEDQVDCAFAVRKNDAGASKKTVDVKCVKPGDMRTPDDFTAEVEFDDAARTAVVRVGTSTTSKESEVTDAKLQGAIRLALEIGPLVVTDIKKKAGCRHARLTEELKGMVDRGELVIINKKYALDGEGQRTSRVLGEIRRYAGWKSEAELAKASYVETRFVEGLVRAGVICRRAAGEAGFLVVDRGE